MASPPGAGEAVPDALTNDERAALAAWADDGDAPDGFADRVVAVFLAERLGRADGALDEDDDEAHGGGAAAMEPRAAVGRGRVVRLVGLVAAVAAAAAVMLMVRVLPRASQMELARAGEAQRAGVERPAAEPPSEPPSAIDALATEAALVLAQHCSPCHDSTDPQASPAALQVFDVEQRQWWRHMSDAQLEQARLRVQQLGAASADDRRRMDAFVAARQRRAAHAG